MKKFTLFIVIALFTYTGLFSQTCLPDGIVFLTQEAIDNFQTNYPDCIEIEGDVSIGTGYVTDVSNLDGLSVLEKIDGNLEINTNENLTNLSGLDALTSIGGYLRIEYNEALTAVNGLDALETIGGGLIFYENHALTDLSGLGALTSIGGELEIGYHEALTSLTGLESVTTIGGLDMGYANYLTDLSGLDALTTVEGNFIINDCDGIETLTGLNSLTTVNGNFSLNALTALNSLTGLESLNTIAGKLYIGGAVFTEFTPLTNLTTIGGGLQIGGCNNITNLSGLENLTSIGGELIISGNQFLESLTGIDNIDHQSITNLKITYNPLLTTCEVKSVCDYLVNPSGTIWLHNNATGCGSQAEVEDACNASAVPEIFSLGAFKIYPNPAEKEISIMYNESGFHGDIKIFNQIGQIVLDIKQIQETINITDLEPGLYVVEVLYSKQKIRMKLTIE